MRSAYLFPAIAAVGLVCVTSLGHAIAAPVFPAVAGYATGVAFTIVASIVVNSCNAARYGRQVWDDQGGMDGVASHAEHMRRDRVRRHSETACSIPVGEPS